MGLITALIGLAFIFAMSSLYLYYRFSEYKNQISFYAYDNNKMRELIFDKGYTSRQYLSYLEKASFDNKIYQGLCRIREHTDAISACGILFHNGGIVPTQVTMLYEKSHGKKLKSQFQNLQTTQMFDSIQTILSSQIVNFETSRQFDEFTNLMFENGFGGVICYLIAKDNAPVMAITLCFEEYTKLSETQSALTEKIIQEITPYIHNLYSKNYYINKP